MDNEFILENISAVLHKPRYIQVAVPLISESVYLI